MLSVQVFGPWGIRSEYRYRIFWIDGRRTRPAAKVHSGKGRAVPERPPVDPGRLRFAAILWGGSITCRNVGEGKHRVFGTDVTSRDRLRNLGMGMTLGFA